MKKIILMVLVLICSSFSIAYAQEEGQNSDDAVISNEEDVAAPTKNVSSEKLAARKEMDRKASAAAKKAVPVHKHDPSQNSKEHLVDLDVERSMGRIDSLERRISAQDREMRSMSDSIRSLSRDVDDLKRRTR
jgi:cell division protein FtsB